MTSWLYISPLITRLLTNQISKHEILIWVEIFLLREEKESVDWYDLKLSQLFRKSFEGDSGQFSSYSLASLYKNIGRANASGDQSQLCTPESRVISWTRSQAFWTRLPNSQTLLIEHEENLSLVTMKCLSLSWRFYVLNCWIMQRDTV